LIIITIIIDFFDVPLSLPLPGEEQQLQLQHDLDRLSIVCRSFEYIRNVSASYEIAWVFISFRTNKQHTLPNPNTEADC
jgi:hypothetical protein